MILTQAGDSPADDSLVHDPSPLNPRISMKSKNGH